MVRPLLSHQTINNVVSLGTTASATSPYRNRSGGGAEVACPCMVNNPYAADVCFCGCVKLQDAGKVQRVSAQLWRRQPRRGGRQAAAAHWGGWLNKPGSGVNKTCALRYVGVHDCRLCPRVCCLYPCLLFTLSGQRAHTQTHTGNPAGPQWLLPVSTPLWLIDGLKTLMRPGEKARERDIHLSRCLLASNHYQTTWIA